MLKILLFFSSILISIYSWGQADYKLNRVNILKLDSVDWDVHLVKDAEHYLLFKINHNLTGINSKQFDINLHCIEIHNISQL